MSTPESGTQISSPFTWGELPGDTLVRCGECGHTGPKSEFVDKVWCLDCNDSHDGCEKCRNIWLTTFHKVGK